MAYQSSYPTEIVVDPEVVRFFETFYKISDTPGALDEYVDLFTEDATLILASKKTAEIIPLRQSMWTTVEARAHSIPKIFPFGGSSHEYMLYGTVALGLKNGDNSEVEWAGRSILEKSATEDKWRMKFYQIYLDTGTTTAYKK
ncbi:hypothetical protein S40288_03066 [Stachybotrys chartarum IBT 40288]|nr:hypothetical protein S40288_03066 [Stachybotrys chartarum IBT 40288]